MTARSKKPRCELADCAAMYEESVQNGDITRLCPPSVRANATEGDTIALAIQHPQHDDATELVYATITQRVDDDITATVLDPHRIVLPQSQYADDETQQLLRSLDEGETVRCQARHVGWLVDKAAVRDKLGWGERRRSALDELRESDRRQQEFNAAREKCAFEKGSVVSVDAAVVKQEKKQRREEQLLLQKSDKNNEKTNSTTAGAGDGFEYDL